MNWVTNSLNLVFVLRPPWPSSVSLSVLKAALQCCEREGPGIKTWLTEWASDKVTFGAVLWSWKWIESCKSSNRSSLKRKSFPNAKRTWVLSAIVNETAWTAIQVVNRLGWNFDQTIHKPWSNCEQLWNRREFRKAWLHKNWQWTVKHPPFSFFCKKCRGFRVFLFKIDKYRNLAGIEHLEKSLSALKL